jgi:3-deoxy-manno-octulosonate cytidylyltransferase (CMP-KDO synthetase)
MKTAIVIPARYASKRLPGKPLLRTTGKYLVQHVYEEACKTRCADVVMVATDDPRIEAAVTSFGGRVIMTRREHRSGTDRVAEAARQLESDIIINLQGDEPLVDAEAIDLLPDLLDRDGAADVATLATPIKSIDRWQNPNCVKVVCDTHGRALYFSRSPIPFVREGQPEFQSNPPHFLQHLGLYAYRRTFLFQLAMTKPPAMEKYEKLEQLRILALGRQIRVGITTHTAFGVDTLADYEQFVKMHRAVQARRAA